mgnify:CR=1 FL=1
MIITPNHNTRSVGPTLLLAAAVAQAQAQVTAGAHLIDVGGEVLVRVAQQVALECAGGDGEQHLLVHHVVAPARIQAVEEPRAPVRVALAVREPFAEEAVAPRHAVHRRDRRRQRLPDLGRERRRDALVGIHAQHPVVLRLLDGELLLRPVAEPLLLHHPGAELCGDLGRPVGAAGVNHHDLVGERQALQARGDVVLGVARDDDGGERDASGQEGFSYN